jgi:peptide/nickel transport system substrate-binding protein
MEGIGLNKNKLFFVGIMLIFAVVFAACESESDPKPSSAVQATKAPVASAPVKADGYKEAPMLTKLVGAGSLKPVTERMPVKEDIMVEN